MLKKSAIDLDARSVQHFRIALRLASHIQTSTRSLIILAVLISLSSDLLAAALVTVLHPRERGQYSAGSPVTVQGRIVIPGQSAAAVSRLTLEAFADQERNPFGSLELEITGSVPLAFQMPDSFVLQPGAHKIRVQLAVESRQGHEVRFLVGCSTAESLAQVLAEIAQLLRVNPPGSVAGDHLLDAQQALVLATQHLALGHHGIAAAKCRDALLHLDEVEGAEQSVDTLQSAVACLALQTPSALILCQRPPAVLRLDLGSMEFTGAAGLPSGPFPPTQMASCFGGTEIWVRDPTRPNFMLAVELPDGRQRRAVRLPGVIGHIIASASDTELAVALSDRPALALFDLATSDLVRTAPGAPIEIVGVDRPRVAIRLRDGARVAHVARSSDTLLIADLPSRGRVPSTHSGLGPVCAMAQGVNPDEIYIVSASSRVKSLSLSTGLLQETRDLPAIATTIAATPAGRLFIGLDLHEPAIVEISADARTFATAEVISHTPIAGKNASCLAASDEFLIVCSSRTNEVLIYDITEPGSPVLHELLTDVRLTAPVAVLLQ